MTLNLSLLFGSIHGQYGAWKIHSKRVRSLVVRFAIFVFFGFRYVKATFILKI